MKKSVALLTSALLATTVVVGAASCASKDVSELAPKAKTVTTAATAITAIDFKKELVLETYTKTGVSDTVDNTGLVVSIEATVPAATEENPNPTPSSYTHKLFDMKANAYVSGVAVTAMVPTDTSTTKYVYNNNNYSGNLEYVNYAIGVIQKLNDGLYYTKKTEYTRSKRTDETWTPWAQGDTTYDIYSREGVVVSNVKGEPNKDEGIFVQDNGTRIYVDLQGKVKKEEDPLAKVLMLGDYYLEVGDYLFVGNGVYSKDGEWVRDFNMAYEFGLTSVEEPTASWIVGSKVFVQTKTLLPENEKKYDFIDYSESEDGKSEDGAQKYNLNTYCYDVEKEKVKEVDFDYVVFETWNSYKNSDVSILWCREIVDEKLSMTALVQSFDEKGKVAVDLQKLCPGATDFAYYTDYAVLYNENTGLETVVKGDEVVGTFVADTVSYKNNVAYKVDSNAKNLYLYNLDGTLIKSVHYVTYDWLDNGNLYYQTADNVCVYDTTAKTEKVITTLDSSDSVSKDGDAYIVVTDTMENEKSVYFLMTDTASVSVDTEENSMNVELIASYSSSDASGYLVQITTWSLNTENSDAATNYKNRTITTTFVSVDKAY